MLHEPWLESQNPATMTRILGIDPGSRMTGYGVIEVQERRSVYIASGCVRIDDENFPERLRTIFEGIGEVVETYRPTEIAIEKVFVQRNVDSASTCSHVGKTSTG